MKELSKSSAGPDTKIKLFDKFTKFKESIKLEDSFNNARRLSSRSSSVSRKNSRRSSEKRKMSLFAN